MQNRKLGLALAGLAAVVAVALFIVLSGSDDEEGTPTTVARTTEQTTTEETTTQQTTTSTPKPKPEAPTITVEDGQPVGGVQELEFGEGDQMRFIVESNVEDEVHMHGYDVTEEVAPGQPARFELEASIPGVFELELHHAVTQIAEITVD